MRLWFGIVILILALCGTESLDNGLALTPPMGWMQWERFRCNINCTEDPENCISEQLFKKMADIMVSDGYLDAGYKYVSIDDCWMTRDRGPDGKLQPDPERFPNGMKHLADYIHSKGLKLGIYADMGLLTCKKYPGSKFYLELDAQTFASWEVDMLKLDCCYAGGLADLQTGYEAMSFYLNRTGRPILYDCSWPLAGGPKVWHNFILKLTEGFPTMSQYLNNTGRQILYACCWAACEGLYYKHKPDYKAIAKHCNMWRNYNDIQDAWRYVYAAIDFYGNNTAHFQEVAGPGGWNDPDELIVGDFGLSYDQERVQFGMWCMMASPLFMSVDLRNIRQTSKDLLLNKNLLRIHSDELLVQAYRVSKDNLFEVWLRPLRSQYFRDGSFAVAVLRHDNYGMPFSFNSTVQRLGMKNKAGYEVTEAFDGKEMGKFLPKDLLKFPVNPTGIVIVTLIPLS